VSDGFARTTEDGIAADMTGYYSVDGPGLPRGAPYAAAVLDGVIVFRLAAPAP
jgi:hypothetical protein